MVPHPGPVWVLFHVWTRGAPAHAGQTQEVSDRPPSKSPELLFFHSLFTITNKGSISFGLPAVQDTWENLHDHRIPHSGHDGPVQYLSGLLELPDAGHLQVL